jgi:hypothetical protein
MFTHYPSFIRFAPAADPAAGGGTPPSEGSGGISLTRQEYDQLISAKAEKATLEQERNKYKENWENAQTLIRSEGKTPEQVEAATRRVMKEAGFDDGYITQYIEAQRGGGGGDEGEGSREEETPRTKKSPAEERIENLERELQSLRGDRTEDRKNYLERRLEEQVTTLTGDKDTDKLLQRLRDSQPEGATEEQVTQRLSKVKETLALRIRRETLDRLRQRRANNGGRWDDRWVDEEASNAARAVRGEYESFMADPSVIGRSPDAAPWETKLKTSQPVKAPTYKRGMSVDDAGVGVREFAIDQLLRGASEVRQGGKTSI